MYCLADILSTKRLSKFKMVLLRRNKTNIYELKITRDSLQNCYNGTYVKETNNTKWPGNANVVFYGYYRVYCRDTLEYKHLVVDVNDISVHIA